MHVIDDYLVAHSRYVESLAYLDAVASLLRDVGEQLLANPEHVHFEGESVWLERRVNGPGEGQASKSPWPSPERLGQAIADFMAARKALVQESDALMNARGPESLKKNPSPAPASKS